ncbi:MAG: lysozyme [Cyanobacteria bacterium P01_A01_bin.114]
MGTWIKETDNAIYLMEGGYYISKISKYPSRSNSKEKVVNATAMKSWFARADAPRGMTISSGGPEPKPLPTRVKPVTNQTGLKRTNANGLRLIKSFEGLRLEAYQDAVGVWTIGYGTTRNVTPGMKISRDQAEGFLKNDLERFEKAVNEAITVPINDNQFSALVAFTYNVGAGALRSSTLRKKLNQGNTLGAADEFLRWNKAGGRVLAGLTRRRKAERALFLGEDFSKLL